MMLVQLVVAMVCLVLLTLTNIVRAFDAGGELDNSSKTEFRLAIALLQLLLSAAGTIGCGLALSNMSV